MMSDKNGTAPKGIHFDKVPTPIYLREVTGQQLEYTHSSDGRIF